jgi:hypothetical protein
MYHRLLLPLFGLLAATLIVTAQETTVSVGVDDWDANNSSTNANHMFINVSGVDGIDLIMGGSLATGNQANRASSVGRDGYGTGTSTFGQSGAWFDGSYLKFGNVSNQMVVDYRIVNNSGFDFKYTKLEFDVRRAPGQANPTGFTHSYLRGDNTIFGSDFVKGATASTGTAVANNKPMGTDTIEDGINEFTINIGTPLDGTGWIAAGGEASFRIKLDHGTPAGAQLDNFLVTGTIVPEPSAFALITGVLVMATVITRRRNK